MIEHSGNLVRLYLPLLAHAQADVRRQASMVLLCTYGTQARAYIQPLLRDTNGEIREQARQALETLAQIDGQPAPAVSPSEMHIRCLGSFQVSVAGRVLTLENWADNSSAKAGWQRVRSVFAYLVHCGRRGTTRQSLTEAIWGSEGGPTSLARTLTALRQTLVHIGGEELVQAALTITDDYCMLNPDLYRTDLQLFDNTFELAVQTEEREGLGAAASLYQQTIDLYGGPYMADVGRGNWVQGRRDLFASHFINASERLAEYAFTQGQYRQCVSLCLQALDADMAADEVTVWLLRAYDALGRVAEQRQAYHAYLRAARIDVRSEGEQHDLVVREYGLSRHAALR